METNKQRNRPSIDENFLFREVGPQFGRKLALFEKRTLRLQLIHGVAGHEHSGIIMAYLWLTIFTVSINIIHWLYFNLAGCCPTLV